MTPCRGRLWISRHLSCPGHTAVLPGERAGTGSSSTSQTSLIWLQLSHLSGTWGLDFGVSVIMVILCHVGMTADSGCRDGWWGRVPGSRFMAESMGSRESSCSPELLLPGEINQMCPALAGKFSLPQELMLRCSFPFLLGEILR